MAAASSARPRDHPDLRARVAQRVANSLPRRAFEPPGASRAAQRRCRRQLGDEVGHSRRGCVAGDRRGAAVERGRALGRDDQASSVAADCLADPQVEDRRLLERVESRGPGRRRRRRGRAPMLPAPSDLRWPQSRHRQGGDGPGQYCRYPAHHGRNAGSRTGLRCSDGRPPDQRCLLGASAYGPRLRRPEPRPSSPGPARRSCGPSAGAPGRARRQSDGQSGPCHRSRSRSPLHSGAA